MSKKEALKRKADKFLEYLEIREVLMEIEFRGMRTRLVFSKREFDSNQEGAAKKIREVVRKIIYEPGDWKGMAHKSPYKELDPNSRDDKEDLVYKEELVKDIKDLCKFLLKNIDDYSKERRSEDFRVIKSNLYESAEFLVDMWGFYD